METRLVETQLVETQLVETQLMETQLMETQLMETQLMEIQQPMETQQQVRRQPYLVWGFLLRCSVGLQRLSFCTNH
jgi:hypothetical protein